MATAICHIYEFHKQALDAADQYIKDNYRDILRVFKTPQYVMIETSNFDAHYYMNTWTYHKWCKGRTYDLNGQLCYSDILIKEK